MVKKVLLPVCAAALFVMLNWGCHREPIKPDDPRQQLDGEITSEPIVENGEEVGYSLSYRSWIIPGTDENGNKAPTPPKSVYNDKSSDSDGSFAKSATYDAKGGGNSNDTISVILHDTFYHVDTIAYVSTWDPDKYKQGNYTCHWDKYGLARPGENNVTITDSAIVLRVQFEEFSFQYRINFETATYRNGTINIPFPHYTPVITDLGVEELESLETICRNDSVLARKVLRHSIKISVGNKNYILKANVMLHRHLPDANPNRYIVSSHMTTPITWTSAYENPGSSETWSGGELTGSFTVHRVWSDGSSSDDNFYFYTPIGAYNTGGTPSSMHFNSCEAFYANTDTVFAGFTYTSPWETEDWEQDFAECHLTVKARYVYASYPAFDVPAYIGQRKPQDIYYDDGVLFYKEPNWDLEVTYLRTERTCDESDAGVLICWVNAKYGPYYNLNHRAAITILF